MVQVQRRGEVCAGEVGVGDLVRPRDGDTGPFPLVSGVSRLAGGFQRGRAADDATVNEFDGGCKGLEERGDFAGAAGGDCV